MKNLIAVFGLIALVACSGKPTTPDGPGPTPAPSATATPVPSISPTATPTASPTATPSKDGVDYRSCDTSIKEQQTPWCTAFAGAASIENSVCRALGKDKVQDLSEGHIFSMYRVYNVDKFAENVPGNKITTADKWGRDSSSAKVSNYANFAKTTLLDIDWIGDGDIEGMKKALDEGYVLYMGHEVPADMASCLSSIRPTTKMTSGGHSTMWVGYVLDTTNKALGGGYFIVKNSWSEACGDGGYQYWPFSLCKKSYCYAYKVKSVKVE